MSTLLLPLAAPVLLVVGWFVVLRRRGVPGWAFFGCGAALPVLCVVAGVVAGRAEDRALPSGCRDGTIVGLECGLGLGRLGGYLGAATATLTLVALAAVSLIVWWIRRRSYRGLPALTR
ncbi:hypothetical protein ACFY36_17750 [Actinoplanes sp. NPDC000266]